MKKLFSYKLSFFVLAVILFWAKTYLSYKTEFNLGVKAQPRRSSWYLTRSQARFSF